MKKRFLRSLLCLAMAVLLTGCTSPDAPVLRRELPTRPPAEGEYPVGDAGLAHDALTALYLPSHDGQTLLAFYETLTYPRTQSPAETVLSALLAHPGNERVRSLGGGAAMSLIGASPVEVSGGVCTVTLSASALQLSPRDLYTACLAIAATLDEVDGIDHVNLLIAGAPVAMDVSGCLPLGTLKSERGADLPVLWEQFDARRAPVGTDPADVPLTAAATLYLPLTEGGVTPTVRRLSFPGQAPEQLALTLLEALALPTDLPGAADMPDLAGMLLTPVEVRDLSGGGKRLTLHLPGDIVQRIRETGTDPASAFASAVMTLTTFIPSLQQVCILTGDGALTSLLSDSLGSLLFPGGLHHRADYVPALMAQQMVYLPGENGLTAVTAAVPYREATSPRAMLLYLAERALPAGLTDADILGLAIDGDTLTIHLSARYADIIRVSGADQRLMAYSIVNTLCGQTGTRRVCFAFGDAMAETLGQDTSWQGEFWVNPDLIIH